MSSPTNQSKPNASDTSSNTRGGRSRGGRPRYSAVSRYIIGAIGFPHWVKGDHGRKAAQVKGVPKAYPRRGIIRLVRRIALAWWALFLVYVGNVAWNLYQVAHASITRLADVRAIWSALALPGLFASPDAPLWALAIGTGCLLALVGLCLWAVRDLAAEQRASSETIMAQVAARVVDQRIPLVQRHNLGDARGTIDTIDTLRSLQRSSQSRHPPADDRSLVVPPRLVGRHDDVAWVVDQLRADPRTRGARGERVCALDGLAGIGKTAVAAVAVRQLRDSGSFADGVAVIDCASVASVASVPSVSSWLLRSSTPLPGTAGSEYSAEDYQTLQVPAAFPAADAPHNAHYDSAYERVLREIVRRFTADDFMGVSGAGRGGVSAAAANAAEVTTQALAGRDALIILDHVDARFTLALAPVLQSLRAADAAVLILTQARLGPTLLAPEQCRSLHALSPAEAMDVFTQALGRPTTRGDASPGVDGSAAPEPGKRRTELLSPEERAAVMRIAQTLGGHPLALVLAGAYAAHVTPDLLAAAQILTDPARGLDLPDGETPRVLSHLFATSYRALPRDAQRLFVALAAFALPEFGRAATLALATGLQLADPEQAVALLARRRLLDITVREDMPPESDRQRVKFHPLLYAYAQQKYARWARDQQTQVADGLAAHYAAYVTAMTPPGRSGDLALGADAGQIAASLEWALSRGETRMTQAKAAVALCAGMTNTWYLRGEMVSGLHVLPMAIALAQHVGEENANTRDPFTLARLSASYGAVLEQVGRWREAAIAYQESLAYHMQSGTERGAADVRTSLGELEMLKRRPQAAENHVRQALAAYRAHGDWQGEANALAVLGSCARLRGDPAAAKCNFQNSMRLVRAHAREQDERATLLQLGMLAQEAGQVRMARRALRRCLQLVRKTHARAIECVLLFALGSMDASSWRFWRWRAAENALRTSRVIARDMQSPHREAAALYYLGQLAFKQLRWRQAEDWLRACLTLTEENDSAAARTEAQLRLGTLLCLHQRTRGEATQLLQEAMTTRRTLGLPAWPRQALMEFLVQRFSLHQRA